MQHVTPRFPSYLVSFVSLLGQSVLHTLNAQPSERVQPPLCFPRFLGSLFSCPGEYTCGHCVVLLDLLPPVLIPHSMQLSWAFLLCFLSPRDTAGNRPWAVRKHRAPALWICTSEGFILKQWGRGLSKERIQQRKPRSFKQKCVFIKSKIVIHFKERVE